MRIAPILASTVLLFAVLPATAGEVYKWTDAEGRVQYGDKPPHTEAEQVKLPTQPSASTPAVAEDRLEKQRRLLDAYAEERRLKREAEEKARKEKAERQRKCADLKDDLRNQEAAGTVYRLDKDGRRVFLSDEERQASTEQLRKEVEYWCTKR